MAKPTKSRVVGKNLLLSVAIGATPVVGVATSQGARASDVQVTQNAAIPDEQVQFELAAQSGDPLLINNFIRAYPSSPYVRQLLSNLPPETLQTIDPSLLAGLSPTVVRSLPANVRVAVGLETGNVDGAEEAENATSSGDSGSVSTSASDGYAN